MARASYSMGKRQREAEKSRKKRDKAERRATKKEKGGDGIEFATQDDIIGVLPSSDEAMAATERRATAPRSGCH